ncbi:hypothetical protein D9M71_198200 [compost metagenome]
MAGGVLADVQAGEEQAEGGRPAQAVEQRAVGDHTHAAVVQRTMAELQRLDQFGVVRQQTQPGAAFPAQLAMGPLAGVPQALTQLLQQGTVGFGMFANPLAQFGGCRLHGQLVGQQVDILEIQVGRHPARQQQHLAGDGGGDVGIAVAVAAHPGGEADRRRTQRQALAGVLPEALVDLAEEVRQRLPERVLDDGEAPFRLVHRARPAAADFLGVPGLGDQLAQARLHPPAFLGQQVGVVLGRQLRGDGVVFLDQRAARHFGGMRGEHQLDLQPGDLGGQLSGLVPGLAQARQQFGEHPVLEGLRLVGLAPADAVVLLGDIGEVEELVERPRHRQQFVLGQAVQGRGELPRAFRRAAPGGLGALADQLDLVEEARAILVADGLAEQLAQLVHVLAQPGIDIRHDEPSPCADGFPECRGRFRLTRARRTPGLLLGQRLG